MLPMKKENENKTPKHHKSHETFESTDKLWKVQIIDVWTIYLYTTS